MYQITDWLGQSGKSLARSSDPMFLGIVKRLIQIIKLDPSCSITAIVRSRQEIAWMTEAINTPVGKITEILFQDPIIKNLRSKEDIPSYWLTCLDNLLSLPDDLRRYTLVVLGVRLNWLFAKNRSWTESRLLAVLDSKDESDHNAFWCGILSSQRMSEDLFESLKSKLIELVRSGKMKNEYIERLAAFVLIGWSRKCLSDEELREALLHGGERFVFGILSYAELWLRSEGKQKWAKRVPALIHAWPPQLSLRTSGNSANLCRLLFASGDLFPRLVEGVIPLLREIKDRSLLLDSKSELIKNYPRQFLMLLNKVLPNDSNIWPYRIDEIFSTLIEAEPDLAKDKIMIELKRRQQSFNVR